MSPDNKNNSSLQYKKKQILYIKKNTSKEKKIWTGRRKRESRETIEEVEETEASYLKESIKLKSL